MDDLAGVIVVAFATWHAVEVFHHSTLFAGIRAEIEGWEADNMAMEPNSSGVNKVVCRLMLWILELLQCPFCLSLWTAWVVWIVWQLPGVGWLVAGLAAARGANLLNDLTHQWCRTPGSRNVEDQDPEQGGTV